MQGRVIGERALQEVRQLVESAPGWSRFRLSVALAAMWDWRSANGSLKDMAARSLMRKLHARGFIRLPAPRGAQPQPRAPERRGRCQVEPSVVEGPLTDVAPVRIDVVSPGTASYRTWAEYLRAYHYLGYRGPVGENLGYLVRDRQGRDLACLLFGAAAWRVRPRDGFIGWDDATRARNLALLTNNTRFLILPHVRVPHLASHLLAQVARRLSADWQAKYGHRSTSWKPT